MYYHRVTIILVLMLFMPSVVSAGKIEDEITTTLGEIDKAREDGADVDDLIIRVDQVVETFDKCGWENCKESVIQLQQEELHDIQNEAQDRQNFDSGGIIGVLVIIFLLVGYLYRRDIYDRISWWSVAYRQIVYEDENER